MEIIGLIPAGGSARRLGQIPCSKEIFPVGFAGEGEDRSPKAVSQYLLDKYQAAGCEKVFFILRQGKWDIPAYYGDGHHLDLEIAYLMLRHLHGVPYTLDRAYPYVRNATVLLGFPDMLYEPDDVFVQLLARREQTQADVVLGLYEVENAYEASKSDMVIWDENSGKVVDISIKPLETDLRFSWINAVWGPRFSEFLHTYLEKDLAQRMKQADLPEIFLGHVLIAAIHAGLKVQGMSMQGQTFLDVGTLVSLEKGWHRLLDQN